MLPHLAPMLFDAGPLPDEKDDPNWFFELKWDGWRAVVHADAGTLRVFTRGRRNIADQLPELAPLARALSERRCILDAELVSPGSDGRPDFSALQGRLLYQAGRRSAGAPLAPVALMIFDLLHLDGRNLCGVPLEDRRSELDALELAGPSWRTTTYHIGDGAALLAGSRQQRVEGLVAKRRGSKYEPGQRVRHWRKLVNRERCKLLVGGYVPDGDSAAALLVGERTAAGDLSYVGRIEHGIGRQLATALALIRVTRSPFADGPRRGVFVRPLVEVEVERLAFDSTLRHARLVRMLVDGREVAPAKRRGSG